jgi:hypothetical protein
MFEHIKAAEEQAALNLNPMPHVMAALKACATRLEAIGETADGAVAEQVKAIDERLSSLTSAVSSLGSTVGAIMPRIEALENANKAQAALSAQIAPAAPPVPPDTTGANAMAQV